jgi:hypothetical protein
MLRHLETRCPGWERTWNTLRAMGMVRRWKVHDRVFPGETISPVIPPWKRVILPESYKGLFFLVCSKLSSLLFHLSSLLSKSSAGTRQLGSILTSILLGSLLVSLLVSHFVCPRSTSATMKPIAVLAVVPTVAVVLSTGLHNAARCDDVSFVEVRQMRRVERETDVTWEMLLVLPIS